MLFKDHDIHEAIDLQYAWPQLIAKMTDNELP